MRNLLISLAVLGWVAHAAAGVFDRIDPNKRADVTGQTVEFATVHFDSVPMPVSSQPMVAIGSQTVDRGTAVSTKIVPDKKVSFTTREYPVIPTRVEPQKNFAARRAELDQPTVDRPDFATAPAKINPRVLHGNTPAGAQELQNQINRIP